MDDKPHFAVDLYHGTAEYYDRYRLPYPEAMTEDLIARSGVSGQGRLLDLACGTGQLAFPLRRSFAEVWAVDREPDFARMVQAKAVKLGAGNIRSVTADAETLDAEPGYFELAVIGSAFHRLDRDLVAARLLHWLRPGGCVALCWADVRQSTSFLPPSVLGGQGAAFDDDLAAGIGPFAAADGTFPHDVGFAYDLARKPADQTIPRA